MALSCENKFKNFSLDSVDPAKYNDKPVDGIEDDIATNVKELKEQPCEIFIEREIKPYVVDLTAEQNYCEKVEISVPESIEAVSGECSKVENAEKYFVKSSDIIETTLTNQDLLKESSKTEKITKQVHFNSEIETFTFVSNLSIMENYNFVEDVTLENTGAYMDVNNAGDSHWRMENFYWKEKPSETYIDTERKPNGVDVIAKQNFYDKINTRILEPTVTVSSENSDVENVLPAEKYTVETTDIIATALINQDLSKESSKKITKQVHLNSDIETFTFVPNLSIMENYNFVEDVTLENTDVSADVNNAGDSQWIMEHLRWKKKFCETSIEKEIKSNAVDVITKQNSYEKIDTRIPESTETVSGESSDVENILLVENYTVKPPIIIPTTLPGKALLKESGANKTEKIIKRVHFNSEVETLTFVPNLSIIENYNFVEDVTLENTDVSIDVNNAGDLLWIMEHLYWKKKFCDSSIEKEIKPNAVDVIAKQKSYEKIDTRIPESTVTVSGESSEVESSDAENYTAKPPIIIPTTLPRKALLKESGANKPEKMIKRVHFNSEVETFTFVPGLSIIENYNFIEDVTPKNSFASTNGNNTVNSHWRMNHLDWKSESNLSCSQRPIRRKRFRHNLLVNKSYARLNDESARQTDCLPRSRSAYYPKKAIENFKNGDENKSSSPKSGNLSSLLSMAVKNLKKSTKAFMNKFLTKVKKRKEETSPLLDSPDERAEGTAEVADKDLKERTEKKEKSERRDSIFSFKKKDGNKSENDEPESESERLQKSAENLKASKSFMDKCKKFVKKK